MSEHAITIKFDTDRLTGYTDEHLVTLWYVTQANPAESVDLEAGQITEAVGREIIRRFIKRENPPLWNHQGNSHYWNILQHHGFWKEGVWQPHAKEGGQ